MKRYTSFFYIMLFVFLLSPACTGGGAPDQGDNDVYDTDEGNVGDIDQIDVTDNTEINDETPSDTAEEPVEEVEEPDTQIDPRTPFLPLEGEWECVEGDGFYQGDIVNLRIAEWDAEREAVKVIGIQPCPRLGFSQKIAEDITFYGAMGTKFEEILCDNGTFNQGMNILTFDADGIFFQYEKLE
ncbi:hypothetical protein HN958_04260 [Candidatus Falkowbacteria bacterium]|jgi:hypothetical protein|nr:hypothetical protein [Candidatus Falkowbacteria bacterium]